jgi:hypothetical protein
MTIWTRWLGALLGLFLLTGCFGSDTVELTGESAFDYMRKDLSSAPKTDVESIKSVMDWAVDDYVAAKLAREKGEKLGRIVAADRVEPSDEVMAILKKTTRPRKNFDAGNFERIDFSAFVTDESNPDAPRLMGVNLSSLENEFYIDNLDAIPVRNQGYRGTCAAFTGVGHLEYATLKAYSKLPTIDLSEQRYYYLSKPECWLNGCALSEEGSWYGVAMSASILAGGPDIPLETDCPYKSTRGKNDLQTPQLDSCSNGAVQVKSLEFVRGAQEIVDKLNETRLPVPFASPLSGNWEVNKGLITYADSGHTGDTSHAAGHAYLIVGYKKLPKMPEEGGMCFVIKNSWGTGWGVNGYSCMTLKWMEEWTFGYQLSHPMAMQVLLRDDLQDTEELPNNEDAEDESDPDVPDESLEPDDGSTDQSDDVIEDELDVIPEPDPLPELEWKTVKLFGPGETYYKAEIATDGDKRQVRAILREDAGFTQNMELETAGVELVYDGDRVGLVKGEELYLCSGQYDLICSLRYSSKGNRLFIEFPNPDRREVVEEDMPKGSWTGFDIPFGDYGFQVFEPESLTSLLTDQGAFFRIKKPGGETTKPVRLSAKGTEIHAMGEPVGSLDPSNFGLCTGDWAKACSIFAPGSDLDILPGW